YRSRAGIRPASVDGQTTAHLPCPRPEAARFLSLPAVDGRSRAPFGEEGRCSEFAGPALAGNSPGRNPRVISNTRLNRAAPGRDSFRLAVQLVAHDGSACSPNSHFCAAESSHCRAMLFLNETTRTVGAIGVPRKMRRA